jgi:hypothetical protein
MGGSGVVVRCGGLSTPAIPLASLFTFQAASTAFISFPSLPSIPKLGETTIVLALIFGTQVTTRAMTSNKKLERASCGRFQHKAKEVET